MSGLRYDAGGYTDAGPFRTANDDHLLLDFHFNLFAVFDAGGSWADDGGRASRIGAEVIQEVVGDGLPSGEEPRPLIERAFRAAGDRLRRGPDDNGWCGSASVALALLLDGTAHVAWLGDSMADHVSPDGVKPLTRAHTVANEMARRGTIREADAASHKLRHVLMYFLGGELPDPLEVVSISPRPGDWLVLTTDGLHDTVPPIEFAAIRREAAAEECAESLVRCAHAAGSRDNATCVAIAFRSG